MVVFSSMPFWYVTKVFLHQRLLVAFDKNPVQPPKGCVGHNIYIVAYESHVAVLKIFVNFLPPTRAKYLENKHRVMVKDI